MNPQKKTGRPKESPERDSNTRPIDYKSIALDQLSYRGTPLGCFSSSLKGFAPLGSRSIRSLFIQLLQAAQQGILRSRMAGVKAAELLPCLFMQLVL